MKKIIGICTIFALFFSFTPAAHMQTLDTFRVDSFGISNQGPEGSSQKYRTFEVEFSVPAKDIGFSIYNDDTGQFFHMEEVAGPVSSVTFKPDNWTQTLLAETWYRYTLTANAAVPVNGDTSLGYYGRFRTFDDPEITETIIRQLTPEEEQLHERLLRLDHRLSQREREVTNRELILEESADPITIGSTQGRILLQVEEQGEAWYVDIPTKKKYYLENGDVAYTALGAFGLGISNTDISSIPIGTNSLIRGTDSDSDGLDDELESTIGTDPLNNDSDNDGYNDGQEIENHFDPLGPGKLPADEKIRNDLQGRILLQVENNGEAWYYNPVDRKRYLLANGQRAYEIMRFLSLGITNKDIRKIETGSLQ